jgi:two-component system, LuxR family, response regulator FixJ
MRIHVMAATAECTIHIVDPERTTLKSTSFLLRALGYTARQYESLDELLRASERLDRGCILLDVPAANGTDAPQRVRDLSIDLPVVVMSVSGDTPTAIGALKGGASDFIGKPYTKSVLLDAIAAAVRKAENGALAGGAEEAWDRLECLSPRERDVLQGLARGCSNKVIAYELGISPRTVEIHRARMMNKLGVRSLSQALRLAFTAGLERAASHTATAEAR